MKTLITGAAGFIGRHVARRLLADGDEVVAQDLRTCGDETLAAATWIEGDIGDRELARRALAGCDRVIHLAAAHLDQTTPDAEYRRINVEAAVALLEEAERAGVTRYVHCSSVGVYGNVRCPPAREDGETAPGNIYEETKLEGELAVRRRGAALPAVKLVVVRPAWVYGPGCPRTARLLRAVRTGRFFYFGSGSRRRHPVYISDFVEGLLLAGEKGRPGAVYNLAGPEAVPLTELIAAVARVQEVRVPRLHLPMSVGWCAALACEAVFALWRKPPPLSRRSLVFFRNENWYSIDAAREDLGYRPVVGIEEGLARALEVSRAAVDVGEGA